MKAKAGKLLAKKQSAPFCFLWLSDIDNFSVSSKSHNWQKCRLLAGLYLTF
jgi:hypothetical protein